jgi:regulator of RNase E activity RraA
MPLSTETRQKLMTVSTATLCTALFKRGLRNQFIQDVRPLNPGLPNMVGEAFTLRYIPAREDLNPITVFQDRAHPQRVAVEQCPPGAVMVIDSRKDARAASAGGILVSRLMKRGVAGVVTDGGFRDSPEIARCPSPPTTTAQRADQPDAAPGAGHQRAHRLRRRGRVAGRRGRGRRRRRGRDPGRTSPTNRRPRRWR